MLAGDWVVPLKLLSAMPRMNTLLRPAPSCVLCRIGMPDARSLIVPVAAGGDCAASITERLPGYRNSVMRCLLAVTTISSGARGAAGDATIGFGLRGAARAGARIMRYPPAVAIARSPV